MRKTLKIILGVLAVGATVIGIGCLFEYLEKKGYIDYDDDYDDYDDCDWCSDV